MTQQGGIVRTSFLMISSFLLDLDYDQYRPLLPDLEKMDQVKPYLEYLALYAAYEEIPFFLLKTDYEGTVYYQPVVVIEKTNKIHKILQEEHGFILEEDSDYILLKSDEETTSTLAGINLCVKKIGELLVMKQSY